MTIYNIPDTEEVRDLYIEGELHDCFYDGDVTLSREGSVSGQEFDLWLNKIKAEVWEECADAYSSAHREDHREPWAYMKANPYK